MVLRRLLSCLLCLSAATVAAATASPVVSTPTVREVEISSTTVFPKEELDRLVSPRPGQPYDANQVRYSVGALQAKYRDAGYYEVQVATGLVHRPGAVDIFYRIREGPLYQIRSIDVEGNRAIGERIIRRQMGMRPGDPYSQSRIYDANRQLFMGGYFEAVDIHPSTTPAHAVDLLVRVKERPTKYVKGGGGYGAETKERLSLGYEDRNFLGNARQFDLVGTYSGFLTNPRKYRTTVVQGTLAQPFIFDSPFEAQTTIIEEWDRREAFDSRSTTWRTSVGRHFGRHFTGNIQYRYQGTNLTRINPEEAETTAGFVNISAIGPTMTYDDTNDVFLPAFGWRVSSSLDKGMSGVFGALAFSKATARVGRYDTCCRKLTFYKGIQGGIVRPDSPNNSMPIFERYFLGGANTVRGYEERELGLKDSQGAPQGGEAFGVVNLELRWPLYKKIYGDTFLDAGQLWQRDLGDAWPFMRVQKWDDLAYGTGLGVRFNTPVGAIRLEVGYKLNPEGPGTPSFFRRTAIHFSLGEMF
jgi:outer membrane protein insertion porin family